MFKNLFKNLFKQNKSQKQDAQKNTAAEKGKPAKAAAPSGNQSGKRGTIRRSAEPADTMEKNKNLLKLAEEGRYEVKNMPEFNIGDTIDGTYKIAKKFSGRMGFVYITEPTGRGIQFAIKQLNRMMLENKSFFARIIREVDTWNRLGIHPNIAYCYFVKMVDGIPCIFIEYVDGSNLREWIAAGECLDIRASLDMSIQFCHGMEQAHRKGVIHRNIKPENVLITKEGVVKITNFGLANTLEGTAGNGEAIKVWMLTHVGDVIGTEAYMAPEQWEDTHNVDERADIFSFGVCMWEMFCGKRPYKIAYGDDIEAPTSAQTLRPELTDSHIELLYKCIELDKTKRYKDFTELREFLNNIYRRLYNEDAPAYIIELHDNLADDFNNRGYSYYQLDDKQKAQKCWEQSLQINSKHLEATYNLNFLKWTNGKIIGDTLLHQLELTENRSPEYWLCVGWVYYMQGNQEAVQKIQNSENQITSPQFIEALKLPNRPIGRLVRKFKGSTGGVNSVCFSADGRYVLSGCGFGIRLWEVATGKEIRKFGKHTFNVNSICFSPDGRFVLSGSNSYEGPGIRLWKTDTKKEIKRFEGHTYRVHSVCFSPDGKFILAGCGKFRSTEESIRLWEFATGKEIRWFEGHTDEVNSICFSPDGKFILAGFTKFRNTDTNKTIRLWEVGTGKEIIRFEGHTDSVKSVCFSPDGRYVLSGCNYAIRLWEVATGKEIRKFGGDTLHVTSVCFSPDGRFILSGDLNRTIRLWEADTGKEIRKFEGHTSSVTSVCFSPDGKFVLSGSDFGGSDSNVYLWEVSYSLNNNISKLFFPILTLIRTPDQMIELQKKANLLLKDAISAKRSGDYESSITILRQIQKLRGYEQKTEILDFITMCMEEGKGIPIGLKDYWIKMKFEGHCDYVNSVCFSPDGKFILAGYTKFWNTNINETIRLWEAATGKEIRRFEGATYSIESICFSSDGKFILSGDIVGSIRLWDTASGKEIRRFEGHEERVESVCFSPDGNYILSLRKDVIRLWEVVSGKEIRKFEADSPVLSVCFSPDGRYIIHGKEKYCSTGFDDESVSTYIDNGTFGLLEVATGKEIRKFEGHPDSVNSVRYSPDGKFILSGSDDMTIRLWEAATGKEIRRFEGATHRIKSICFSPDGRYILSVMGAGNDFSLWRVATGKEIRKFEGHTSSVRSVCFSSDGRYVISGSDDKTVLLWELDWEWGFPKDKA